MRFKPHDRLLLAACLCGALACAAIASSRDFNPPGTPIPDGKLALVRGSSFSTNTPQYCDDLAINHGAGGVGAHQGCIGQPAGTICVACAMTSQVPSGGNPPGNDPNPGSVNCNIEQFDKQIGFCNGQGNCGNLQPTGANCQGFIDGSKPE